MYSLMRRGCSPADTLSLPTPPDRENVSGSSTASAATDSSSTNIYCFRFSVMLRPHLPLSVCRAEILYT